MRAGILGCLLCVAGCGTRLVAVSGALTVEPSELTFPATALGGSRELSVRMSNSSRAPLRLELQVALPFAVPPNVTLGGGESREVTVKFAPDQLGEFAAALQIRGDVELEVAVSGSGIPVATCHSTTACKTATADPVTNRCVEQNAPDGTSCASSSACLEAPKCVLGVCTGTAVSCDDADACTVDLCEAVGGCQHVAKSCPAPVDPCQVAQCDARTGCSTVPVADGTLCGPSDCTTAHVCMAGVCRTQTVPDGFACGEQSPCRPRGQCQGGACNQPPATALTAQWSRTLPERYDFRGVTDPAGNFYWVECEPTRGPLPCTLVSANSAGFVRFEVAISTLSAPSASVRHMWSAGRVIVGTDSAALTAFSDSNGAVLWSNNLRRDTLLYDLAADRTGRIVLISRNVGTVAPGWSWESLDGATGMGFSRALPFTPLGLVVDEAGNSFITLSRGALRQDREANTGAAPPALGSLLSLSPMGLTRFEVSVNVEAAPTGVFNGNVVLSSGQLFATFDGADRTSAQRISDAVAKSPLLGLSSRYHWTQTGCCPTCSCASLAVAPQATLQGFAPGIAAANFTWSQPLRSSQLTHSELTAAGDALFASLDVPSGVVQLRAISASGNTRFSCALGASESPAGIVHEWSGAAALRPGQWAAVERVSSLFDLHQEPPDVLRVYAVPSLAPGSGWAGAFGGGGRGSTPR